jgi:hypothetical protein
MAKRKEAAVFKAFNDYNDRVSDLLNNPKYEKMSNEEIDPLFEENEQMLKAALLKDEDETCRLLGSCLAFSIIKPYFAQIQQHLKSKKLAKRLNDTLEIIKRGEGKDYKMNPKNIPEAQKMVNDANKYVE